MTAPLAPDSALATALARGRQRFNARYTYGRRIHRRLDAAAFSSFLASAVAPIVEAVAAVAPSQVDPVTEALFDLALKLVGRELAGPTGRIPVITQLWQQVLPQLASQLALEPKRVARSMTNAVVRLAGVPQGGLDRWFTGLVAAAPLCPDADTLLAVGQVLAWRSGIAHYRASALQIWASLPDALRRHTLQLPADADLDAVSRSLQDPWWLPNLPVGIRQPSIVGRVVGFQAFGGPFESPPEVGIYQGQLYAWDDERCVALHADAFGVSITRADKPPAGEPPASAALQVDPSGRITGPGIDALLAELADSHSQAANATTLAVSFARSHQVLLVAAVPT